MSTFISSITLADIQQALGPNHPTIRLFDRGSYVIADYVVMDDAVFKSNPLFLECRGIAFDKKTGQCISRPFHKFFNLHESGTHLDANTPIGDMRFLEKLDGSMIRPIFDPELQGTDTPFVLATRGGHSPVAKAAQAYLQSMEPMAYQAYVDFFTYCHQHRLTCMFEWCNPEVPIVLQYQKPNLTLLAVRHNDTGLYHDEHQLIQLAQQFNIPLIAKHAFDPSLTVAQVAQITGGWVNAEGLVGIYQNQLFFKLKSLDYVQKHKSVDQLKFEKDAFELILDQKIDDILPLLAAPNRLVIETYRQQVQDSLTRWLDKTRQQAMAMIPLLDDSRTYFNQAQALDNPDFGITFDLLLAFKNFYTQQKKNAQTPNPQQLVHSFFTPQYLYEFLLYKQHPLLARPNSKRQRVKFTIPMVANFKKNNLFEGHYQYMNPELLESSVQPQKNNSTKPLGPKL